MAQITVGDLACDPAPTPAPSHGKHLENEPGDGSSVCQIKTEKCFANNTSSFSVHAETWCLLSGLAPTPSGHRLPCLCGWSLWAHCLVPPALLHPHKGTHALTQRQLNKQRRLAHPCCR